MAEEEFNSSCYDNLGGLGGEAPQLEIKARALARALILVYIYVKKSRQNGKIPKCYFDPRSV